MSNTPGCLYSRLDNGIHEFTFPNPDRQAVDTHFEILEQVYAPLPDGQSVSVMIVLTNGFPPMNYVLGKARTFNSRHIDNPGHYAFLYQRNNVMLSVLQSFLSILPVSIIMGAFFTIEERDKAIAWLLAKRENPPKK